MACVPRLEIYQSWAPDALRGGVGKPEGSKSTFFSIRSHDPGTIPILDLFSWFNHNLPIIFASNYEGATQAWSISAGLRS